MQDELVGPLPDAGDALRVRSGVLGHVGCNFVALTSDFDGDHSRPCVANLCAPVSLDRDALSRAPTSAEMINADATIN